MRAESGRMPRCLEVPPLSELTKCPACGYCLVSTESRLDAKAEEIRQWCRTNEIPILLGDCIRRSAAAAYLGRSEKTLGNWAAVDSPIPFQRLNGRAYYEITDLAAFALKEPSR